MPSSVDTILKECGVHLTDGLLEGEPVLFQGDLWFLIGHCAKLLELISVLCHCQLCFWLDSGKASVQDSSITVSILDNVCCGSKILLLCLA